MGSDADLKRIIKRIQKKEKTHHEIYKKIGNSIADQNNKKILSDVADVELKHYNFWKSFSQTEVKPQPIKIFWYCLMAKVLGLSFTLKLMEKGERLEREALEKLKHTNPDIEGIIKEAKESEEHLLSLIDEEWLKYTGSMVLGLSDAIVELTGALAGFTLALRHTKTIAVAGVIMGIAASLSMSASEYLETKEEDDGKNPFKASFYTGIAYVFVVFVLLFPFFVFQNPLVCLGVTLCFAILVMLAFNYYVSVAKRRPFKKRFLEMLAICLGVAVLNFFVGLLARKYLNLGA